MNITRCKVKGAMYIDSDAHISQGTFKHVKKKNTSGKISKAGKGNGNYLVASPAQVCIVIEDGKKELTVDISYSIKHFYGRKRMTKKLFEEFKSGVGQNAVGVFNVGGEYILKSITD